MLVVDGVELVALDESLQVRELDRDDAVGLEESPDSLDEAVEVGDLGEHLAGVKGDRPLFARVRAASSALETALPTVLPTTTLHGDYAPRNVLVSPSGGVAVIDAMPTWRAPVHEDVARMIAGLRLMRLQLLSGGLGAAAAALDGDALVAALAWAHSGTYLLGALVLGAVISRRLRRREVPIRLLAALGPQLGAALVATAAAAGVVAVIDAGSRLGSLGIVLLGGAAAAGAHVVVQAALGGPRPMAIVGLLRGGPAVAEEAP